MKLVPTILALIGALVLTPALAQDPVTDDGFSGLSEEEIRGIVQSVLAEEDDSGESWKVGGKNKLTFTSPDGNLQFRIGGRIHQHWTAWSADDEFELAGALEDSTHLRRARLYTSGTLYGNTKFKIQYDFGNGVARPADVYLELREFDGVNLRAGHFREPFGLDTLTSSNNSTFVERNLSSDVDLSRNMGFMAHHPYADERGTWAIGAFRATDSTGSLENDGQFSYTGRLTYLPLWEDDGKRFVHIGAAASFRNPEDSEGVFEAQPAAAKASEVLNTGTLDIDTAIFYGAEFGGVMGGLSWQAEYVMVDNDLNGMGSDPSFSLWYAQAAYVLTGESRKYSRSSGVFGSVVPDQNFGDGGWGAFEVGARYSCADFSDGSIDGGEMGQFTLGANWYLNPIVRIMANVVLIDVDSIAGTTLDGKAEAFTMRFQVNF